MRREDSDFGACAAWFYQPEGRGSFPCVVMANGFSLTRHDGLPQYAERFAAAGIAVLLFDHRNFGDSPSSDPQRFRVDDQRNDWREAVAHARSIPSVDQSKVVLWGYSFSAGHAIHTAAKDPSIAAVLTVCPFLDGLARVLGTPPLLTLWMTPRAIMSRLGRPLRVPVTAPPGGHGLMTLPGEYEGFLAATGPKSPWANSISPGYSLTLPLFRPIRHARQLQMPVWIGKGEADISMSPRSIDRLASEPPHAELVAYPMDHFGCLVGSAAGQICTDQIDFLQRAL